MTDLPTSYQKPEDHRGMYLLKDFDFNTLSTVFILKHSAGPLDTDMKGYFDLEPQQISLNFASFSDARSPVKFPKVDVLWHQGTLIFTCDCLSSSNRLCEHQSRVLFNIKDRNELRLFFDEQLRHVKIRSFAAAYGLEHEQQPDDFFSLSYDKRKAIISPVIKDLLPVTQEKNKELKELLLAEEAAVLRKRADEDLNTKMFLVLKQHRYYSHFQVELMESTMTGNGKIKNPLKSLNAADYIWTTDQPEEIKFYTAVSRFQNNYESEKTTADLEGLKALTKNPLLLKVFCHDPTISPNITTSSVLPVSLTSSRMELILSIDLKDGFYTIQSELLLAGKIHDVKMLSIKFQYFIAHDQHLYLVDDPACLRVITFMRQNNNHLIIHESKFASFQTDILTSLENKVRLNYSYVKPATKKQLKETHFDQSLEKIIYLSYSEDYVLINPVMRYGSIEVPVLSRKQIYATDKSGKTFTITRNDEEELNLVSAVTRQHPYFQEQLDSLHFYLHKKRFLEESWFLNAFEAWGNAGITLMGFNEIYGNNLNPNKVKISIAVISGLNWFDSEFDISFGKQKVSLKQLHRSVSNKSKFIKLGDGTMGILPEEWIEKLTKYFSAAEITEDTLRTPKVNFSSIIDLYEQESLSAEVRMELSSYKKKIDNFRDIAQTSIPLSLNATLRDYQKEGLNWLNFLDEFGFGGCLADDMGLGKTLMIIAFILSQREKRPQNTNLIVVPATLIFNWQAEIAKFAPDLKVYTIYGAERAKITHEFHKYEIILTSYGTLLYDIGWLKKYNFNYIFLDESQTIKNPESLRYHAVRLLQSRNKIAITGTPVENNTFDLYGQLSFACPGLLGSKQFFRENYSSPIDKFKDNRTAIALRKKVKPFILRRTKNEVARELPEKTEMVIYCEMETEQKTVYDACKDEYKDFLMGKKDDELPKHTLHMLKGLTLLRQICNSPSLLKDDLLHGAGSAKIRVLMEEIENHSPQHKILIFSQFVSMLDLIKAELQARDIPFEYLTGKTTNRKKAVQRFQEDENVRIFLISLKAGGTGLNLTEADYVYLVDPWWNPAVENQAIDRSYRIGQQKNVVAVRLICPDTIEEKIMKLQATKKELAGDLIHTDNSLMKSLTKKDLLDLFS
ncbi:SNF2-related protein [Pedobacter sp. AW31-3R]|uniref:DEAD/DEAH box helicase n=1 Tax=Pedobacter sp. AW31-3R TaxID=3445781 RepID=UPI003FA0850F